MCDCSMHVPLLVPFSLFSGARGKINVCHTTTKSDTGPQLTASSVGLAQALSNNSQPEILVVLGDLSSTSLCTSLQ